MIIFKVDGEANRICPRCDKDRLVYYGELEGKPKALCDDCLTELDFDIKRGDLIDRGQTNKEWVVFNDVFWIFNYWYNSFCYNCNNIFKVILWGQYLRNVLIVKN